VIARSFVISAACLVGALATAAGARAEAASEAAPLSTPVSTPRGRLAAGATLEAVRDVALEEVQLVKGSKVRVVRIEENKGRPVAVDVELKDGYVLKGVSYSKVAANFRPVATPRS
jgi:hypothetical protein